MEGKYTIKINDKAVTVSVPLRERVRQKLKELEKKQNYTKSKRTIGMDLFDGREDKKIRRYSNLSRSERSKQINMQGTLSTTSLRRDRNQAE